MNKRRAKPFSGPGSTTVEDYRNPSRPQNNTHKVYRSGPWVPKYLQGEEVLSSSSHPDWYRSLRDSRKRRRNFDPNVGDIGGPFSVTKRYATLTGGRSSLSAKSVPDPVTGSYYTYLYDGLCVPNIGTVAFPPFANSPKGALDAWGTSAIARCKPTNVFEDMSSSLAEFIREGIPKLGVQAWKDGTQALRNVASGHLSHEFGFKPIISDIQKTLLAQERARTVLEQYKRDSGKLVRRRYEDKVQTEKTFSVFRTGSVPQRHFSVGPLDSLFIPEGNVLLSRETSTRRWFSGAFTYHLPIDNLEEITGSQLSDRGLVNFDLTPETLWNIAPWSWAVDWIVPVGDLIGNLQDWATDGLVLQYGYVMEHTIVRDTYTQVGKNSHLVGALTLTSECKQRVQANPFGFGLDWNGLSPRQLSIVAALGITKR